MVTGQIAETTKPAPLGPVEIATLNQIGAMAATIAATEGTTPAQATAEFSRLTKMAVHLMQHGHPLEGGTLIALLANLHAQSLRQPADTAAAYAALIGLHQAVQGMLHPTH
ncbi:MAG: hypothetical protein H7338_07785 [Candidatus Sericytochromatia bacterium]|nr:hypothetical protein [Candidatus Sericytochromatia bacterium]